MYKYDVFLSFRGEDTRKNFLDHLYTALIREGINIFRDDKELKRGKPISPELLRAIEESKISIIIFSRNYVSSTWCLDELAKIIECMNRRGQIVIPIFYDVDPSMVRNQSGVFGKVFAKHEETFREKKGKVQTWKKALTEMASLSGFHLKDRHESAFIQDVVKEISKNLNPTTFMNIDDLVGINSRLEKLKGLIRVGSNDVRMIGICGMGGIGKTTIARVVYDLISYKFKGSCFLANVRENSKKDGLVSLQKQLLSQILMGIDVNIWDVDGGIKEIRKRLQHRNVLVVIDDVDHEKQMNKLAGKHDWFGLGSRIIITTRNKHLLVTHKVDDVYDAKELSDDEAFKLFTLKAFDHEPSKDYVDLINRVIKYAGGLPLALEVLGSFFLNKTIDEWESALKRLNKDSEKGILDNLELSFEGLEETEKKIFLDVACFFKGRDRNYVTRILDGCGFESVIGIRVLVDKSLITISNDNILWMHNLLQQMGHQIVKRESPEEPGKRSRLWEENDVRHVLTENTGSELVEGIMVSSLEEEVYCSPTAFSKMINLRLLKISNVQLPKGLEYLSNKLRLFDWVGYPLKYLPANLKLDKILELRLTDSPIKLLWKGTKVFNTLTSINFKSCQYLKRTPDFTWAPDLKEVILLRCIRLHEIHPSLLLHKRITDLNLAECTSLTTLPINIHMESLLELNLSLCSKLEHFPEISGSMECLLYINLCGTAIKELPSSIKLLRSLVWLDLNDCKNLASLPTAINGLRSLEHLLLSGCSRLRNLPDTLLQVESLRRLDLSGTAIRQPMPSIFIMKKLFLLNFSGCKGPALNSLFPLCSMMNLMPIRSSDSMAFRLPYLSGLCASLTILTLSNCNLHEDAIPGNFFASFPSLMELDLSHNNLVSLPRSISCLLKLEYLNVNGNISLETLSNALRLCNLKLSSISCVNCLKLISHSSIAFSMLKEHINKALLKSQDKFGFFKWPRQLQNIYCGIFSMVVPGNKIPTWFSHECEGPMIRVKKHPCSYDSSKFVGYMMGFVFSLHSSVFSCNVRYNLEKNGKNLGVRSVRIYFDNKVDQAMSDHLAFIFFSRELFDCENVKHNGVRFSINRSWEVGVKRCGVHTIYEEDLKEFNKINNLSRCWNWNDFHQDDDDFGSTDEENNDWDDDDDDVGSTDEEDNDWDDDDVGSSKPIVDFDDDLNWNWNYLLLFIRLVILFPLLFIFSTNKLDIDMN